MWASQGPIAELQIKELSFARTENIVDFFQGIYEGISSLDPKLPLSIRGVRVELRIPPPTTGVATKKRSTKNILGRVVDNWVLRLVLACLPAVPITIQDVAICQKVSKVPNLHSCDFCYSIISSLPNVCFSIVFPGTLTL